MNSEDSEEVDLDEFNQEWFRYLINNGFKINPDKIKQAVDKWKTAKINIGFIGESGSGKTTLINTLRGLYPNDKGAGEIGIKETTSNPSPYLHPENSNIILWDLPGVNTPRYPLSTYLDEITIIHGDLRTREGFQFLNEAIKYDCFVICCTNRFHDTDLQLAKQLAKRNIRYYFVRTKIDEAFRNYETKIDRRLLPKDEDEVISVLKKEIENQLAENLLPKCNLFALSALMRKFDSIDNRTKYEFAQFQNAITENLYEKEKQSALTFALFPIAKEAVDGKTKILRKRIWPMAALSGAGGLVPVPGVSLSLDMGILIEEVIFYIKCLKLTTDSLKKIADSFGVDFQDLKQNVLEKDQFFYACISLGDSFNVNILKDSVKQLSNILFKALTEILLVFFQRTVVFNTIEEYAKSIMLYTVIGLPIMSLISGSISFISTAYALKTILDCFEKKLIETLEYCKANRTGY